MADTDNNGSLEAELTRLRQDVKAQRAEIERLRAANPPPPQKPFPRLAKFGATMGNRYNLDRILRLLFCLCKGLGNGPLATRYGKEHWASRAAVQWAGQIDTSRAVMDLLGGVVGVDLLLNSVPERDPVLRLVALLQALGCIGAGYVQAVYYGFAHAPEAAKRFGVNLDKWGWWTSAMWLYFVVLDLFKDCHRVRMLLRKRARLVRQAEVPKSELKAIDAELADIRLLLVKNSIDGSLASNLMGWNAWYTSGQAGLVGLVPSLIALYRLYRDA